MRAGVAALQHTLTLQAAVVLRNAVADARRRGHAQVQPLHVAAMLLACPGSPLRQACIQSHPYTASHPLQCRALELCFHVALERLPASASAAAGLQQPGLSNALVAALKRAQAQQRRGCPEQQQQPLLAVRVEMEHLIISILDDPSVSRVMREAGFDSTHVKCNMEEAAVCTTPPASASSNNSDPLTIRLAAGASQACGFPTLQAPQPVKSAAKHIPRQMIERNGIGEGLQMISYEGESSDRRNTRAGTFDLELPDSGSAFPRGKDVECIVHILLRHGRCNPVLIGDSTQCLNSLVQELAQRIEKANVPSQMQGVQFLSLKFASLASGMCNRKGIDAKLAELRNLLDRCMPAGAILYLGDLQWLVEPPPQAFMAFCPVRYATSELGRLLFLHGRHRVWVIGTASSQTYLKCQAQHPLFENQWQLQPVQFAPAEAWNSDLAGSFIAKGVHWKPPAQNGTPLEPAVDEEIDSWNCCAQCLVNCEQEKVWLHEQEAAKSQLESAQSSSSSMCGDAYFRTPSLVRTVSFWLERHKHVLNDPSQNSNDEEAMFDLRRKWQRTCRSLHKHIPGPQKSMSTEVLPEPSSSSSPSYAETPNLNRSPIQIPVSRQCISPLIPHLHRNSRLPRTQIPPNEPLGSKLVPIENQQLYCWHSTTLAENAISGLSARPKIQHLGCTRSSVGKFTTTSPLCNPMPCTVETDLALGLHPPTSLGFGKHSQTDLTLGMPQVALSSLAPSSQCTVQGSENRMHLQMPNERLQDVQSCTSSLLRTSVPSKADPQLSLRPLSSIVRMPMSGLRSLPGEEFSPEILTEFDADNFKVLCQELTSRIPWQAEPIKFISNVVWDRRSCMGRRRGPSVKSDVWLLLLGPDKLGKRELAKGLAKLVFGNEKSIICTSFHSPVCGLVGVGADGARPDGVRWRGTTCLDRLVHAVRQKPFSVLLMEDVDQADSLMRASLVKAMERGRLADSSNREASFANVIVLMTAGLGTEFLPPDGSGSDLELLDVGLTSNLGMKLLVGKAEQDRAILHGHDGMAVICHDQSGHLGGISKHVWSHLKRKPGDRNLLWSTCKRRKGTASGRLTAFDLNLSAEENSEDTPEEACSTVFKSCSPNQLEQQVVDKVITSARKTLSPNFCAGVDEIVIFRPVNLHDTVGSVLKKLQCIASKVVALGAFLEIELCVLEQMALARLQTSGGDEAFKCWVLEVLDKTLVELVCSHGDLSGKVVKLVGAEQSDCLNSIPLPSAIVVGHCL